LVKHVGGLFTADPRIVPEAQPVPRASHHFLSTLAAAGARVISFRAATLAEREAIPLCFASLESETALSDVSRGAPPAAVIAVAHRSGRNRFTAQMPGRIDAELLTAFRAGMTAAGIPVDFKVTEKGRGSHIDLLVDAGDLEACLAAARRLLPRGRNLALLATGLTSVTVVGAHRDRFESLLRAAHTDGAPVLRRSVSDTSASFIVPDAAGIDLLHSLHASLVVSPGFDPEEPEVPGPPQDHRRSYVGRR
jgi:aspartokinase